MRILFALIVLAPLIARADTDRRGEAKRLKNLGVAAAKRGDYHDALENFERAYRTYPSAPLKYNIGVAQRKLGMFDRAVTTFEALVAESQGAADEITGLAETQIVELERQVARIDLHAPEGASVFVDGSEVGSIPLPRPLVVLPGAHRILIRLHDRAGERALAVRAGEHVDARVDLSQTPAISPPPAPVETAPPPALVRTPEKPLPRGKLVRGFAWGTAGLAVALAAVGTGVYFAPRSDYEDLKGQCARRCAPDDPRLVSLKNRIDTDEKVAYALFGLAGAAAIADIALWIIDARSHRSSRLAFAPSGAVLGF